jgi:hypothetical protein
VRVLLLICAVWSGAMCAAQEPAEVRNTTDSFALAADWIHGSDPLRNAWAVYLIRRDHLSRLAPELHRVVAQSQPSRAQSESSGAQGESSQGTSDVQLAALDAMIEVGEPVSLTELEPFVTPYPTLTLILASRASGDSTALLLKLLDHAQRYEAYIATANLLLPRRSPEFTRRVMSSLRVHLNVNVVDPGSGKSYGGGWAGDSLGMIVSEKPGWPPIGHYQLTESAGDHLLAPGPHPIYYVRTESRRYSDQGFVGGGEESGRNRNQRNLEYVASMLGVKRAALGLKDSDSHSIEWRGGDALIASLRQLVEKPRSAYREIAAALAAAKQLAAGDVPGLHLQVQLSISDARENPSEPLPDRDTLARLLSVDVLP